MNGQQHYDAAEKLLELAESAPRRVVTGLHPTEQVLEAWTSQFGDDSKTIWLEGAEVTYHDNILAAAQVHATLAVAAAGLQTRIRAAW